MRTKGLSAAQLSKIKRGVCITFRCRKKAEKHNRKCASCNKKLWAEKNPLKYKYNALRQNAKRRGKECTLTLDEFIKFATSTGYDKNAGRTKRKLHIDRKLADLGYTKENIQALKASANCSKGAKYERGKKYEVDPDCGF